jgi:hypothetical protein
VTINLTSGCGKAWDVLFDALIADRALLAERVREAMQEELPAYRGLPVDGLAAEVSIEVERVLVSARAGEAAVSEDELMALSEIGERRALQGIPIEDMLRAWRIGVQVVVGSAQEVGAQLGVSEGAVLEFVKSTLAWADVAMINTARGHRRAELELARREHEHRATFVRAVLLGGLALSEVRAQAGAYGLDPDQRYVAVRGRTGDEHTLHALEAALAGPTATAHRRGLTARLDGDVAGLLREPPHGELPGVVGVGPPQPLDRLPESYRIATRAFETAAGFGFTGVFDLPALGLRAAVSADRDVGEALRRRYIDPLDATPSAEEVKTSLRAYFACGMHVERASERLFVHPNTLRYRIGRFEQLAGVSLRDPASAFEVWWALERAALRPSGRVPA